jgi:hypothetical protein
MYINKIFGFIFFFKKNNNTYIFILLIFLKYIYSICIFYLFIFLKLFMFLLIKKGGKKMIMFKFYLLTVNSRKNYAHLAIKDMYRLRK